MAKRPPIKVDLSVKGIEQLKRELLNYKEVTLKNLLREYVTELAQEGITVGQQNVGGFVKYITFSIQTNITKDGCKALMVATETGKIISSWQTADGIKTAEVSPLLMAEFGSGWGAENPMNVPGVGQGTFPSETAQQNAFNKEGWYWMDLDGNWNYSKGITAKMPMYKASQRIQEIARSKAREVFGK